MKTKSAILAMVICISGSLLYTQVANAQLKGFSIGPYLEIGNPTAGFEERNGNGIGVGMNADIKLPGRLGLTGSIGYMHFSGISTSAGKTPTIDAVPIRGGIKFRLPAIFYLKMEVGVAKYTNGMGSSYIVAPGIGIRVLGLDVQGKFEAWLKDETNSFWGLKVGYNF